MTVVSPQARGTISPDDQSRLLSAIEARAVAEAELRAAVRDAADNGASVRELAVFTGLSTNTVSRWKRDA